jgi:VIT1/CCC1 family predicted Fe2+/Mn2+ transporter
VAFTAGAVVPIAPYIFSEGMLSFQLSIALSALALLIVGGALSFFTGKNSLWGALRMLFAGGIAAGVTYTVGRLIGVSVAG